ncbi:MAG TPA: alpha-L-fucosidase [Opitutaceae bacterium]|nr:alpha-L-fucosidase [Opitutaceae bacterium]
MSSDLAPILEQRAIDVPVGPAREEHRWFSQARLGMFVHYGLYSLLGRAEWVMYLEKIPPAVYNRLAADFTAHAFDADALVSLAKRAGAGYVVLVARHHDGFCLWETATTSFNSVQSACGRDLVREYVDACRRAGLRVGLYMSVMSWQWPAIFQGPDRDPQGWRGMVDELHAQCRELMSRYGQIDVLWYDGCMVPGISDPSMIAAAWRATELNAMVRSLQPHIVINDRASLPEDFSTPEQHLTLPPAGRAWEMCMTLGNYWGWHREDRETKRPADLIRQLVHCARFDGNLLLNVGPEPEGAVSAAQVEALEAVGRWMELNGEAVRGTRRTAYTEADHLLGPVTAREKTLYFHVSNFSDVEARIAGLGRGTMRARWLAERATIATTRFDDGTALLTGLPAVAFHSAPRVIALEFDTAAPVDRPPAMLVEKDTGQYAPAEATVHRLRASETIELKRMQELKIVTPVAGRFVLELAAQAPKATPLVLRLDGRSISGDAVIVCGHYPNTLRSAPLMLAAGEHTLTVWSATAPFTLLAWRLQPLWRKIEAEHWLAIGPFPSRFQIPESMDQIREAMRFVFPPEQKMSLDGVVAGLGGRPVRWFPAETSSGASVDFTRRASTAGNGVYYARTTLVSAVRRHADVLIGCDWWANLFVNGELVASDRDPAAFGTDGSWFNGWKPIHARVALECGENELLVKCHQGRAGNWFTFFLQEADDLRIGQAARHADTFSLSQ